MPLCILIRRLRESMSYWLRMAIFSMTGEPPPCQAADLGHPGMGRAEHVGEVAEEAVLVPPRSVFALHIFSSKAAFQG